MSAQASLAGFLPAWLEQRIAVQPDAASTSWSQDFEAVVLFADISGFTPLAERLAVKGKAGAEELSRILNACFGPMVDLIIASGGDIVRFAGDAPIVVFGLREAGAQQSNIPELVAAAAYLGVRLHETMRASSAEQGVELRVRVSIGAGRLSAYCVGGVQGRRELLVTGEAISQVAEGQSRASPGDVVLSPAAASFATSDVITRAMSDGFALVTASSASSNAPAVVTHTPSDAVRAFIPSAIASRIASGHTEWLAEMRPVSVLFLKMSDTETDVTRLDSVFQALQRAVYAFGGSINQFVADDKGIVLLALWGVPGSTFEDDASRAISAAVRATAALDELGVQSSAGVASGSVFCGLRGNARRREYAAIGRTVNLAARLMTARATGVRCDQQSFSSAANAIVFGDPAALQLKGVDKPVTVHTPVAVRGRRSQARLERRSADVVGRVDECTVIAQVVSRLSQQGGGALLIEGDPGIGKSTLFNHAIAIARTADVGVFPGMGDAISQSEAYGSLREPLSDLLGLASRDDRNTRTGQFHVLFRDDPPMLERLPLVAAAFGLEFAETAFTTGMTEAVRAEATRELLIELIGRRTALQPAVIAVDNAHWLDSLSWELLGAVVRRIPSVLVVLAMRGAGHGEAPARAALAGDSNTSRIALEGLSIADISAVITRTLGVSRIAHDAVALIARRSGGNPLFVIELVNALRAEGVLAIDDAEAHLTAAATNLSDERFPDTLQGLLLSRIDRLTAEEQLTVKVASVIGPAFDFDVLVNVHPIRPNPSAMRETIASLEQSGLIDAQTEEGESFVFRNALVQEAAYDLLATPQKRALHREIAAWQEGVGHDVPPYALLAHHWVRAAEFQKGVESLEGAGGQAYASGADREAARFFRTALDLADREKLASFTPIRRVRWQQRLAASQLRLGENTDGGKTLNAAFEALGTSLPASKGQLTSGLLRQATRQTWHRLFPRVPALMKNETSARETELIALAGLVPQLAFYEGDNLKYIFACLLSVNLAESAREPQMAASAYVALGFIASSLRLDGLAARWWSIAEQHGTIYDRTDTIITRALNAAARGDFSTSENYANEGVELARSVTNWTGYEKSLWMLLCAQSFSGNRTKSEENSREMLASATRRNHRQHQVWALAGIAGSRMWLGDHENTRECLTQARRYLADVDSSTRLLFHDTSVRLGIGINDNDLVLQNTGAIADLAQNVTGYGAAYSRATQIRGWLRLHDENLHSHPALAATYLARARSVVPQLRRDAFFAPMIASALAQLEGELHWRASRRDQARKAWQKAMELAQRRRMPREELLARVRLAESAQQPDHAAHHHRMAAELRARHLYADDLGSLREIP